MADNLTITVDTHALLEALIRLGPAAEQYVHAAARVTAERIQVEARGRVRRATGRTAAAITLDEAGAPLHGWRVFVAPMPPRAANLPIWIEFGTKFMSSRPFLFSSATLEEGRHQVRIAEAVQHAIDEVGLG